MRPNLPVLVSAVSLAILLAAPARAASSVTLTPSSGHPNLAVAVAGSGFADNEAVDVYVDTADTLLLESSSTGTLSAAVTVPASAQPGAHYVTAIGRKSGNVGQAVFTVTTAWSQLGFNAAHYGQNPYENTINTSNVGTLGQLWAAVPNSSGATPAVVGGKVYISTQAGIVARSSSTGAAIWSNITNQSFVASPAVVSGTIYIGDNSGNFYSINATTGNRNWTKALGGDFYSSATVVNGVVYVGNYNGNIYALQASTGTILWSYKTGSGIDSSPAVVNGVVYIGSFDSYVYALNATTGAVIWTYQTGSAVESSPAVANGVLYVGSDDDKIYAIETAGDFPGSLLWSATTAGEIYWVPAIADGSVFVASSDANFYAFDAHSGAEKWSIAAGGQVYSPVVANGVVYFTSSSGGGTIYATDLYGDILATASFGHNYFGSPVISDGVVYLSAFDGNTFDGNTYAFGLLSNFNGANKAPHAPDPASLHPDPRLKIVRAS